MALSSINRAIVVGNLTRDPELRPLPSGQSVCHLRIACNGRRRTQEGKWEERPNYFDVSVFGPQGVNAHRYLSKGRAVAIDGRLEWREWETTGQPKRQSVSIIADTVQFLGAPAGRAVGEGSGDAEAGAGGDGGGLPAHEASQASDAAADDGAPADSVLGGVGAAPSAADQPDIDDTELAPVGVAEDDGDDLRF